MILLESARTAQPMRQHFVSLLETPTPRLEEYSAEEDTVTEVGQTLMERVEESNWNTVWAKRPFLFGQSPKATQKHSALDGLSEVKPLGHLQLKIAHQPSEEANPEESKHSLDDEKIVFHFATRLSPEELTQCLLYLKGEFSER